MREADTYWNFTNDHLEVNWHLNKHSCQMVITFNPKEKDIVKQKIVIRQKNDDSINK